MLFFNHTPPLTHPARIHWNFSKFFGFLGGKNTKILRMVRNAQKMISRMFFIVGYFPHLANKDSFEISLSWGFWNWPWLLYLIKFLLSYWGSKETAFKNCLNFLDALNKIVGYQAYLSNTRTLISLQFPTSDHIDI